MLTTTVGGHLSSHFGLAGEMPGWLNDAIEPVAGVKSVEVELTWDPPWGMDMMSDEARLELGFM